MEELKLSDTDNWTTEQIIEFAIEMGQKGDDEEIIKNNKDILLMALQRKIKHEKKDSIFNAYQEIQQEYYKAISYGESLRDAVIRLGRSMKRITNLYKSI